LNERDRLFLGPLVRALVVFLTMASLTACAGFDFSRSRGPEVRPLTVSGALGQIDSTRDASLRLVIEGLDADTGGRPDRALASYQRAVRVDPTNPFAYLALARHHLENGSLDEADAFLGQTRALFENGQGLGDDVDVWGIGLRAGIDRARGLDERADQRFEAARTLSPEIWADEHLSSAELR